MIGPSVEALSQGKTSAGGGRRLQGQNASDKWLAGPLRHTYDWLMLDWSQCPAVERLSNKGGGEWLFKDTRIPVRALFENLEGGARVDDFLEWFPGVTREQVEAVLQHAEQSLLVE